jgi:hypothetical protein
MTKDDIEKFNRCVVLLDEIYCSLEDKEEAALFNKLFYSMNDIAQHGNFELDADVVVNPDQA